MKKTFLTLCLGGLAGTSFSQTFSNVDFVNWTGANGNFTGDLFVGSTQVGTGTITSTITPGGWDPALSFVATSPSNSLEVRMVSPSVPGVIDTAGDWDANFVITPLPGFSVLGISVSSQGDSNSVNPINAYPEISLNRSGRITELAYDVFSNVPTGTSVYSAGTLLQMSGPPGGAGPNGINTIDHAEWYADFSGVSSLEYSYDPADVGTIQSERMTFHALMTPEPSSALLTGLVAGALLLRRRR